MFDVPQNRRARINAARLAGYGTATSTNKSIAVIAARLADDEAIQLAIEEEGRRRFRTLAPIAHNALKKLLQNPKHRDHGKAVLSYIEHALPLEMRHQHLHQHEHRHRMHEPGSDAAGVDLLRRFKALGANREFLVSVFGCNGLPRLEEKMAAADEQAGVKTIEHVPAESTAAPPAELIEESTLPAQPVTVGSEHREDRPRWSI
jgi:phage terminase small subunit